MAIINLPILRTLLIDNTPGVGSTTTVPADETWLIYDVPSVYSGAAAVGNNIYFTIDGNRYDVASQNSGLGQTVLNKVPRFTLKPGDTLRVDSYCAIQIVYWIIEIDFGVSFLNLPALRQNSYVSNPGVWTTLGTVPANETWAVHFTSFKLNYTAAAPTGATIITAEHRIIKDGFIVGNDVSNPNSNYFGFGVIASGIALHKQKFAIQTGDTIQARIQITGPVTGGNLTTNIGYWIIEQDF